jgi:carboxypeptidase C (cathepsin A)
MNPTVTRHTGNFQGQQVSYAGLVEDFDLPASGNLSAVQIVAVSYIAESADSGVRPIAFVFNGGPIAASSIFHMSAFGPRRLDMADDQTADPNGFSVVDNPNFPIDELDVVFFDPAGTGFSRAAEGHVEEHFSVDADARQAAAFIRAWCERHGRTESPKVLVGTSYGTIRAARLAELLVTGEAPLRLDGVYLLGQALNIIEISQRPDNIVALAIALPTLAVAGWYHGKVDHRGKTLEQHLDAVREFASNTYLPALYRGTAVQPTELQGLAGELQKLTGLAAGLFVQHRLRVTKDILRVELLKAEGKRLSVYDCRYTAPLDGPATNDPTTWLSDPSVRVIPAVQKAFAKHLREFLAFDSKEDYRLMPPEIKDALKEWDWGNASPFADWPYAASMRRAMQAQHHLKVIVGIGRHDTTTTIGGSEYVVAQSGWPADRVAISYYDGGHMSYFFEPSLGQFLADVRGLARGVLPGKSNRT